MQDFNLYIKIAIKEICQRTHFFHSQPHYPNYPHAHYYPTMKNQKIRPCLHLNSHENVKLQNKPIQKNRKWTLRPDRVYRQSKGTLLVRPIVREKIMICKSFASRFRFFLCVDHDRGIVNRFTNNTWRGFQQPGRIMAANVTIQPCVSWIEVGQIFIRGLFWFICVIYSENVKVRCGDLVVL